jgi:hypothetical protein
MKMKIYAVRDRATDQYGTPMFMIGNGQAIRSFGDEMNNKESQLNKHSDDYDLYTLGEWDSDTGEFTTEKPKQLAIGKDLIRE